MSKHEDIIKYILSLETGTKISVRSIASELGVSDGTAYRAIKDSDSLGIVTTIPRVGTVRIEKVEKKNMESLTYGEVINIVDGSLLGGKNGVHKVLHRFIIGAMTIEAMKQYIKKIV
ncbi:Bacterial regulatory protein, gntR family [Clostridium ljungdahlii]|uniref:Bacterial regulatory protein, gntR family n=1 Tax=Clostridium ljungdahlii TaxID=1538 RepID=A0A168NQZ0_9CLOT|nr:Bacterial regulatory protein, gntR family [Clostridium ljungdahlii]